MSYFTTPDFVSVILMRPRFFGGRSRFSSCSSLDLTIVVAVEKVNGTTSTCSFPEAIVTARNNFRESLFSECTRYSAEAPKGRPNF
jgi:hypothetical protein